MKLIFFLMMMCSAIVSCDKNKAEEVMIKIVNHKFVPSEIIAPANKKLKIIISNNDNVMEEFESIDLHREKIVPANSEVHVFVGPLSKGEYKFFGEFHKSTANGILIIKEDMPK
jgi:hypothetical protein